MKNEKKPLYKYTSQNLPNVTHILAKRQSGLGLSQHYLLKSVMTESLKAAKNYREELCH